LTRQPHVTGRKPCLAFRAGRNPKSLNVNAVITPNPLSLVVGELKGGGYERAGRKRRASHHQEEKDYRR